MYSQCPDCLTRFRVTAAHLRAAGGTVRCGRCGAAFDALATLTDTLQGPEAAALALATGAIPPVADDATPAGAYHFSADDLERVFIDARDWHRQFGKSAPIVEPDEVAEAARAASAAAAARFDDTRTQVMPTPDDFEPPAWASDIADDDLESTQPLPVLRGAPEARLFDDEDDEEGLPEAAAIEGVETGAVEPGGAQFAAEESAPALTADDLLDEGGYVPAQVEPEVEAIFESAPERLADVDVTLEPMPADGEPATPVDVELDLAAVDIEFEEFGPGTDGTPPTVDLELQPAPADAEPEPLDVELAPADLTVVEPLLTEPAHPDEVALVANYELADERVPWPPLPSEPLRPSGLEAALARAPEPEPEPEPAPPPAPAVPEPEIWSAPAETRAEPAVVAAVARGSAADLPLGGGRWRATREAEAELDSLDEAVEDERGPFPWGWALGCLLLLLGLGAQLVHQYRDTLLRDPRVGPWVAEAYARLGRPLAPLADPTLFELRQEGNVADSPQGTLHVRASITNEAAFAQAPPQLRVSLEDRFGNEVTVRDFKPADYVPEGATAPATLAAGEKIPVDLLLLDPGGDAVGFQLRTCVPDGTPGRLRCGP